MACENSYKRKKVAVLIRNFVTTGGAERYAVEVTKRLAEVHEVKVICQEFDFSLCDNLEAIFIPKICEKPRWLNQIIFAYYGTRASKIEEFDVVITHDRTYQCDLQIVHCPCYKTKYSGKGKWGDFVYDFKSYISFRHLVYAWLEKKQFGDGHKRSSIYVSKYIKENVKECYPADFKEGYIAPPGVLLPESRCERPNDGSVIEVLFVGTEFKRKGLEFAIRGFAKWGYPKKRLRVAGGGDTSEYKELAKQLGVSGSVQFLGLVEDVGALYQSSHIFLFPTLIEPFGMSPLEAMSYGLPVVISSSKYNGFVDHISDEEAFILQNPEDGDEIAKALESVRDENRWKMYSDLSLKVAERMSWENCAKEHLVAIEESTKS